MDYENGQLIVVRDLRKYYNVRTRRSGIFSEKVALPAVDGINFEIRRGEVLGLVGESGCGKTTTGMLLVRLEQPDSGSIMYEGTDVTKLDKRALRSYRRKVQMIFQDPFESVDPRYTVYSTVVEPLVIHGIGESKNARREMVVRVLDSIGLAIQGLLQSDPVTTGFLVLLRYFGACNGRVGMALVPVSTCAQLGKQIGPGLGFILSSSFAAILGCLQSRITLQSQVMNTNQVNGHRDRWSHQTGTE